jgi:hypothetical protein
MQTVKNLPIILQLSVGPEDGGNSGLLNVGEFLPTAVYRIPQGTVFTVAIVRT